MSEDDNVAEDPSGPEPEPKKRRGPPPASEKQLKFAAVLRDKIKLTDEEFAGLLEDVCGKTTMEGLLISEASELIDALQTEARERGVDLDTQPKVSEKQVGFIKSLKRRAHLTDAEFTALLEDMGGVTELEELGRRDASSLIDELKTRAEAERAGKPSRSSGSKKTPSRNAADSAPAPPPRVIADEDDIPF